MTLKQCKSLLRIFTLAIISLILVSTAVAQTNYASRDSADANGPAFNFIDISATGTFTTKGDKDSSTSMAPDGIGSTVPLGTPFTLFGVTYTELVPTTEGYITTDPADTGNDISNDCPLPKVPSTPTTTTGSRIYPLHDDIDVADAVYYEHFETCPRTHDSGCNMSCNIFMWHEAGHWPDAATTNFDFEAILYQNSDIVYQYATGNHGNPEKGVSSTTGIQSAAPGDGNPPEFGFTHACNTLDSILDDSAVWIFLDDNTDGVPDSADNDCDGSADLVDECDADANKATPGQCGCGTADTDTDSDGTADCLDECATDKNKTTAGVCGCGVADTDSDSDGTADCNDECTNDPAKTKAGACGCGIADTDSNGNGVADCLVTSDFNNLLNQSLQLVNKMKSTNTGNSKRDKKRNKTLKPFKAQLKSLLVQFNEVFTNQGTSINVVNTKVNLSKLIKRFLKKAKKSTNTGSSKFAKFKKGAKGLAKKIDKAVADS